MGGDLEGHMKTGARPGGPLSGFRVVEMEGLGPAPFAAMWLADMGATVLRINRPGQRSNQTRAEIMNRGRRSIAVDMKRPGASELVLRMIETSDALLEGFRPGVMERLGLGPDICLARNPRLVYGRMTGWGQDGPLAQRAGHDINYISLTGALAAIGTAESGPVPPLNLLGDFGGGGMLLIAGVLAALLECGKSGRGQVVDAAMIDGTSLLMAMMWGNRHNGKWLEQRQSNFLDGAAPFYGTYCCADGGFVAVGAIEDPFWQALLERCGVDDPVLRAHAHDKAQWPALRARMAAIFLTRPRDEWCRMLEGTDACLTPVLTMSESLSHPQAIARAAFIELDGVQQPAAAPRFSRTPAVLPTVPPLVGEHSTAILREFGFTESAIAEALASGMVQQAQASELPPPHVAAS